MPQQKRNTSITYSSSLKELLQRKISALEQQLQRHQTATLSSPEHHDDDSSHRDDGDHHDEDHHDDKDPNDHKEDHSDSGPSDSGNHTDHHDDDHHEADGDHDDHDGNHEEEEEDDDGDSEEEEHSNEADSHSYLPHTGYRAPGPRAGFHSNKLETMLNQLHLAGTQH